MEVQQKGEKTAVREMRKHIAWYIKGMKEATKIREKVNTLQTKQEVEDCLTEYFKTIQNKYKQNSKIAILFIFMGGKY